MFPGIIYPSQVQGSNMAPLCYTIPSAAWLMSFSAPSKSPSTTCTVKVCSTTLILTITTSHQGLIRHTPRSTFFYQQLVELSEERMFQRHFCLLLKSFKSFCVLLFPQVFETQSHSFTVAVLLEILNGLRDKCLVSRSPQFHIPDTEIEAVTPGLKGG